MRFWYLLLVKEISPSELHQTSNTLGYYSRFINWVLCTLQKLRSSLAYSTNSWTWSPASTTLIRAESPLCWTVINPIEMWVWPGSNFKWIIHIQVIFKSYTLCMVWLRGRLLLSKEILTISDKTIKIIRLTVRNKFW